MLFVYFSKMQATTGGCTLNAKKPPRPTHRARGLMLERGLGGSGGAVVYAATQHTQRTSAPALATDKRLRGRGLADYVCDNAYGGGGTHMAAVWRRLAGHHVHRHQDWAVQPCMHVMEGSMQGRDTSTARIGQNVIKCATEVPHTL